jgi:hypothetical protein
MSDFVAWVGDVLALEIAVIGTVSVTLGLILAGTLIFGFALSAVNKIRGRA